MKLITSVLILALTGTALAQAPAKKPATGPAATKQPASAAKTHAAPAKTARAAAKPSKKAVAKAEKKPAAAANPPAEQKNEPETKLSLKNRRDPFVSVVVSREGPPCAGGGKKCIAIDQVTLQGVVRGPSGPIAVVSSGARKTYFLRENDPVYNGVVVKISPDSIIFRETIMDRLGKTSQREVVKRIPSSPAA
jgi:hypothetical protein